MEIRFLDLFAGAGGLSEGFIQAGYHPVAHVEMDRAACLTLKTRAAFHYLENIPGGKSIYRNYLLQKISREQLYSHVPQETLDSVICETIGEVTTPEIIRRVQHISKGKKIDVIIGGPPCQAYSVAGRAKIASVRKQNNQVDEDHRKLLYRYYVQFLRTFKPRVFLFENVVGLLTSRDIKGARILPSIRDAFEASGYRLYERIFDADQFGVPQRRKRLIIIGVRNDINISLPEPEREEFPLNISDLFSDLLPIHSNEGEIRADGRAKLKKPIPSLIELGISDNEYPVTYHQSRYNNERDLEIYRRVVSLWREHHRRLNYDVDLPDHLQTHKNRACFQDRYKVVDGESQASHTVVAHICKDGHYYIHPDLEQNRSLTPREAARLQTFPDNYFFESPTGRDSRMYAYRQVGNAVPVLLARKLALMLRPIFEVV